MNNVEIDLSKLTPKKLKELKLQHIKHGTENTFRLTDEYIDKELSSLAYRRMDRIRPSENRLVDSGSWIAIVANIPVSSAVKPKILAIYWGVPCTESLNADGYDKHGRYKVEISVRKPEGGLETVAVFPDEYIVVSDDQLEVYIESGWQCLSVTDDISEPVDLELIERGRCLTEEERESIWALQVDGLNETQACQQYFHGRHVNTKESTVYYDADPEIKEPYIKYFGLE